MKENTIYTKNDLIFNYSRQEFPTHLIEKNILNVSDFIFENEYQDPESNKKKIKIGSCFLIEEELEPRKNFKGKKPYPNQFNKNYNQNQNNNPPNDSWTRTEPDDPGFFDDFKGKSDAKQVFAFKRNLELSEMREINIMVNKTILLDLKEREEKNIAEGKNKKNGKEYFFKFYFNILGPKEIKGSADDLFSDEGIFSNFSTSGNKQNNKEKERKIIFIKFNS